MNKLIRKPAVVILGLVLVAMLWLAFRPELLFVNKSVDDPFPTTGSASTTTSTTATHL